MSNTTVTNPQVPPVHPIPVLAGEPAEQETAVSPQESEETYQWELNDRYPPHALKVLRPDVKLLIEIFNIQALLQTKGMLPPTPISIQYSCLAPDGPKPFDTLINDNQDQRAPPGDRKRRDWYSDAVFAQQHFTGTNPTTITLAKDWVAAFEESAEAAKNVEMLNLLRSVPATSLYVQDYSYFRSAMGLSDDQDLASGTGRYGCAPIALFHLPEDGRLHPLAIVIDYKGSMAKSVVIFNKRLTPGSGDLAREAEDWPWRYAKTCVQSADWLRHEVAIHLVNTHLVEEATIVAAHLAFPSGHIVYQLLEKHWETTLSLNLQARKVLVPDVIAKIVGVGEAELFKFLNHAYSSFHWSGLQIPNDLATRGFPLDELPDPKSRFHNYAYARNMVPMWNAIRSFVARVLNQHYQNNDDNVLNDKCVQEFCEQMRSPQAANMPSFPEIKSLNELINIVTMCIHIASPQHTAVNYLQDYYQVFVPNKPWAMYAPLPSTLNELQGYEEQQLLTALPFENAGDWLIGAQLPYLLSFQVPDQSSLLTYAAEAQSGSPGVIGESARKFEADLIELQGVFKRHSQQLDDQETKYMVMDPAITAVSVLI